MEQNILLGKRIFIFLNKDKDQNLARLLNYWGAEVEEFPVIHTATLGDYSDLNFKLDNLEQYKILIFTSVVSVDYFIARVLGRFATLDCLKDKQIITSGWTIAKKLLDNGINIDFVANDYNIKTVIGKLEQIMSSQDKALFITGRMNGGLLSGDFTGNYAIKELNNVNLQIDEVEVFSTNYSDLDYKDIARLRKKADIIIITNFFALKFFGYLKEKKYLSDDYGNIAVVGPIMGNLAEKAGLKAKIVPQKAGVDELISAILDYYITK